MNGNIHIQKKKNQKNTGTFTIVFNVSRPASSATESMNSEIRRLELKEKRLLKKYRNLEISSINGIDANDNDVTDNDKKPISMPSVIQNNGILFKTELKSPISMISLLVSSITLDDLPPNGSLYIPSNKAITTTEKHDNQSITVISPSLQSSLYLEFNLESCQNNSLNSNKNHNHIIETLEKHENPSITVISPSNSRNSENSLITVNSTPNLLQTGYVYKAIASFHLDSKASWDSPFRNEFILYENHLKFSKNDTNNNNNDNDISNNRDSYFDDNTVSRFSNNNEEVVENSFLGIQIICAGEKYGFLSVSVKSLKALMMNSDDGQITVNFDF
jgi:hypothetical protein